MTSGCATGRESTQTFVNHRLPQDRHLRGPLPPPAALDDAPVTVRGADAELSCLETLQDDQTLQRRAEGRVEAKTTQAQAAACGLEEALLLHGHLVLQLPRLRRRRPRNATREPTHTRRFASNFGPKATPELGPSGTPQLGPGDPDCSKSALWQHGPTLGAIAGASVNNCARQVWLPSGWCARPAMLASPESGNPAPPESCDGSGPAEAGCSWHRDLSHPGSASNMFETHPETYVWQSRRAPQLAQTLLSRCHTRPRNVDEKMLGRDSMLAKIGRGWSTCGRRLPTSVNIDQVQQLIAK